MKEINQLDISEVSSHTLFQYICTYKYLYMIKNMHQIVRSNKVSYKLAILKEILEN